jgi:hypothetical protein
MREQIQAVMNSKKSITGLDIEQEYKSNLANKFLTISLTNKWTIMVIKMKKSEMDGCGVKYSFEYSLLINLLSLFLLIAD